MADGMADVSIAASEESKAASLKCTAEDQAFWAREFAWCQEQLDTPLPVTVSAPVTTSSFTKTFVTYLVSCSLTSNPPRRRFSEFVWLRTLLISRYPGMYIPPLPEKRVMNLGDEFITNRMSGLNEFFREVMRNPYLREDTAVREFLTQENKSTFDKYKKNCKANETEFGQAAMGINEGTKRWEAAMSHLPVPSDGHACCTSLKRYVEKAEQEMSAALNSSRKFASQAAAYATALDEFKMSLENMRRSAINASTQLSTTASDVRAGAVELADTLEKSGTAFNAWHDLAAFQSQEVTKFLSSTFETGVARLRALRELLAQRDIAFTSYQSAFSTHQKRQVDATKLAGSSNGAKSAKADAALKKAEEALAAAETRMNNCVKGIIFYEIGRRDADRHTCLKNSIAQFAALGVASAERSRRLWSALISDLAFDDSSELLSATQEALSGNAPAFVERSIGQFAEERKLDVYGASNGIIDPPPEPVATPAGAGAGAGAGADAMPAAAAVPAAAAAAPPQPPAAGGADALPASPAPTAAGADALPAAEGEDAAPAADGAGAAPAAAAPAPAPAPANPFANLSDDDEGNLFGGDDSTFDL